MSDFGHGPSTMMNRERTIKEEFGGKTWQFKIWKFMDYHEKTEYILSLMKSPMGAVAELPKGLPQALVESVIKYAVQLTASSIQIVSAREALEFDVSNDGMGFKVWRALRDSHAEFGFTSVDSEVTYRPSPECPRGYTMGPKEGIQAGLDWLEQYANTAEEFIRVKAILANTKETSTAKNSSGQSPTESSGPRPKQDGS